MEGSLTTFSRRWVGLEHHTAIYPYLLTAEPSGVLLKKGGIEVVVLDKRRCLHKKRFVIHKPQRRRDIEPIQDLLLKIQLHANLEETLEPLKEMPFRLEQESAEKQILALEAICELGRLHNFGTFVTQDEVTIVPENFTVGGDPIDLTEKLEELKAQKETTAEEGDVI